MSEEKKEEGKHKVRVIEEKIKVSESVNIMKFNAYKKIKRDLHTLVSKTNCLICYFSLLLFIIPY
jgi:hypothetical protein